tara:strand:- start:682 stop:1164 length:483 start_codon:yes stop_codon:yes gene_type:complete
MKNPLFFLIFVFITLNLSSQTISKQVISSLGANTANNSNRLSYSLGEVLVGPLYAEDGSLQLANGYYPSFNLETLSAEISSTAVKLKFYPNPVNELLYVSHPTVTKFNVYLTDVTGKKIFKGEIQKKNPINFSNYPKGIYLLSIMIGEIKKKNTYKIIKQ